MDMDMDMDMDMNATALADPLSPGDAPVTAPSSPLASLSGAGSGAAGLPLIDPWSQPAHPASSASSPRSERGGRQPAHHRPPRRTKRRRHPTLHTPNLPIPDLRFEQSFLASIRSCILVYPPTPEGEKEKLDPAGPSAQLGHVPAAGTEWWTAPNVRVQWRALLHKMFVTQFISQPLSGAIFFVLGLGWTAARLGLRSAFHLPGSIARPPLAH